MIGKAQVYMDYSQKAFGTSPLTFTECLQVVVYDHSWNDHWRGRAHSNSTLYETKLCHRYIFKVRPLTASLHVS